MLKLPKELSADPRHDEVQALLTQAGTSLWENGTNLVPTLPFTPRLGTELRRILATGMGTQGLEQITKELGHEQKGLDALAEKDTANPQKPRISRVLFMANDGSERFYRECDSVLTRFSSRLLGCRLDLPGEILGASIFNTPKLIRAILITDRTAVSRALLALLPEATPG